jgi:Holliday junction DNA helicase RuvB
VRGNGEIDAEVSRQALELLSIDGRGLDAMDRRVLQAVAVTYQGGPVGLKTIAASIREDPDTIMDVVEPYLMQLGFMQRTAQGRVATREAYNHLGLEPPQQNPQPRLLD